MAPPSRGPPQAASVPATVAVRISRDAAPLRHSHAVCMASVGDIKERRRYRARGVVQGVGFRPFVHRLAHAHGLAGFVLNDGAGVVIEAEGPVAELDAFAAELVTAAPGLARVESLAAVPVAPTARALVHDSGEQRRRRRRGRHPARRRDVRRLPARALRPGRPPLPLPVPQLHAVRAALHDRALRPVRPRAHDDGGLRALRRLPARVRGSLRPPLPRRADRVPGVRAAPVDAARGGRLDPPRRRHRRRQGARRLPPRVRRRRRGRGRAPARAQAPRGEAARRHDRRPRCAVRPRRRGARAALLAGAADRARAPARRRPGGGRRSRPARRGSASCSPTPRSTICSGTTSACRSS